MSRMFALTLALFLSFGNGAMAQDQTLADIRQELSVLYVEIQRLKRELSTTGGASANLAGSSTLERLDLIESELSRLTAKTEQLENRINRIVEDGTNRIGDLEFRLVELEGGDLGQLGTTTTLGGDIPTEGLVAPANPEPGTGGDSAELAVGEQADFDAARAALDAGQAQDAAEKFSRFTQDYTGGPLTGEAHYLRGEALSQLGDTANAARAYLESFSGSPESPRAPEALFKLGVSLGKLGQLNEACISLDEVAIRFPRSPVVAQAQQAKAELGCG